MQTVRIYDNSALFKLVDIVTGDAEMGLSNKDLSVHLTCKKCGADRFVKTSNAKRNTCLLCRRVWNPTENDIDDDKAEVVSAKVLAENHDKLKAEMDLAKAGYLKKIADKVEAKQVRAAKIAEKLPVKKTGWKGADEEFFKNVTKAAGEVSRPKVHKPVSEELVSDSDDDEDIMPLPKKSPKKPVVVDDDSDIDVEEAPQIQPGHVKELLALIAEQNALIAKQNALLKKMLGL